MDSIVNEVEGPVPDVDPPERVDHAAGAPASREVRVGRWPFLLALVVAAAFWRGTDLDALNAVFAAVLVVLFPVVAVAQLGVDLRGLPRRVAYLNSIATILGLAAVALALGTWRFGFNGMGLARADTAVSVAWAVGLTVAGMAIIAAFAGLRRALGWQESPFLRHMLPTTRGERRLFAVLSISAGVGEELVFRSYLIAVLALVFPGVWMAAAVAAVLFAAVHAYQGVFGMVRTAVLGGLLAAPLIVLGSIWPAMVAHTAIDLLAGLVFAERLADRLADLPEPSDHSVASSLNVRDMPNGD